MRLYKRNYNFDFAGECFVLLNTDEEDGCWESEELVEMFSDIRFQLSGRYIDIGMGNELPIKDSTVGEWYEVPFFAVKETRDWSLGRSYSLFNSFEVSEERGNTIFDAIQDENGLIRHVFLKEEHAEECANRIQLERMPDWVGTDNA